MVGVAVFLVLFCRRGENSTTSPDPVGEWTGQVSLDATGSYCLSSDDDRLVTCQKYSVRRVELPAWLSPREWAGNCVEWKYTWGAGVDPSWPEAWQRGLATLEFDCRYWAAKLLKTKKFRSEFRASLRNQIVAWLETPAVERKYGSPLSWRQWEALSGRRPWEPGQVSSRLYYYRDWPGEHVSNEDATAALGEKAA